MAINQDNLVKTKNVVGVSVRNPKDEDLGKIEEIVLDKYNGNVVYVVLSFGGLFGMGDKLFALPWKAIHYEPSKSCFILNKEKEELKNAPGFDKNEENWPNMADQTWGQTIHQYYETKPYWLE